LLSITFAQQKMGRILAIDYGGKRTGLAVTDPLQIIAGGLETVATSELLPFLVRYLSQEEVECIVIGEPRRMHNVPAEIEVKIGKFIQQLAKKFPNMKLARMDERFTSKMAFQTLIDAGAKKGTRRDKALVDKVSATIILQSYLESENVGGASKSL